MSSPEEFSEDGLPNDGQDGWDTGISLSDRESKPSGSDQDQDSDHSDGNVNI